METDATQECDDTSVTSLRWQSYDRDQLTILRLDVTTIREQIEILHHEMQDDPCLTSQAIQAILEQINAFTDELEKAGLRIRELETLTPA